MIHLVEAVKVAIDVILNEVLPLAHIFLERFDVAFVIALSGGTLVAESGLIIARRRLLADLRLLDEVVGWLGHGLVQQVVHLLILDCLNDLLVGDGLH